MKFSREDWRQGRDVAANSPNFLPVDPLQLISFSVICRIYTFMMSVMQEDTRAPLQAIGPFKPAPILSSRPPQFPP
ncbi:hypothetical protein NECAME_09460 [Necator americanus]|uniref:Uncharacterized protein n=1 Tax=Necator americanus TaxID=51031 RepID=W2TGB3_NECAM|nr:hypothetical protein NECAME_09460 [Necator americanus]ETN80057.1 hypothetical protein NECAME_09460 [Necator americanus]